MDIYFERKISPTESREYFLDLCTLKSVPEIRMQISKVDPETGKILEVLHRETLSTIGL